MTALLSPLGFLFGVGALAAALYALFCNAGNGGDDFSGILKMITGGAGG